MLEYINAEYRVKCEDEGNYLEAGRAHKQLGVLRKQEEKRQQRAVKSRQNNEKDEVLLSHNAQFSEFNDAWDGYMAGMCCKPYRLYDISGYIKRSLVQPIGRAVASALSKFQLLQ